MKRKPETGGRGRADVGIQQADEYKNEPGNGWHATWRRVKMNLAIRGIDGNLGSEHADSSHCDAHPDFKADFILANSPLTA